MLIEEAQKRIKYYEEYIQKIKSYSPKTMEQEAIYLYVQLESVTKVAKVLNEKGYRVGKRKLNTVDVSEIIKAKPQEDLHEMAKKMLSRNKRKAFKGM